MTWLIGICLWDVESSGLIGRSGKIGSLESLLVVVQLVAGTHPNGGDDCSECGDFVVVVTVRVSTAESGMMCSLLWTLEPALMLLRGTGVGTGSPKSLSSSSSSEAPASRIDVSISLDADRLDADVEPSESAGLTLPVVSS